MFKPILDETIQIKLHFAQTSSYAEHPPGPWQEYEFPIFFGLKSGKAINISFQDGEPGRISQKMGAISFLPPFRKRQVELIADESREPLVINQLGISFRLFGNLELLSFWEVPLCFEPSISNSITQVMEKIIRNNQSRLERSFGDIIERQKLCLELLDLIIGQSRLKPDAEEWIETGKQLAPAIHRLKKAFHEPLRIAELAKSCSMSKSQFHQKFKQIMGTTPIAYQQQLRLAETQRLLLQTNTGVAEIGEICGWEDAFHFSRTFKKHIGHSPSQFRRKYQKDFDRYFD